MMERIMNKFAKNLEHILRTESHRIEDADIVVVSYGVSARTALAAVEDARERGIRAGLLRLITVWPFPSELISRLAARVKGFVTVEQNLGQIHLEVQRAAAGKVPAYLSGHAGGSLISPEQVLDVIEHGF
jgi:2-oxoglutarate ferredoxin oxidoreductase subunit alpha